MLTCRRGFADVDDALFDTDQIPLTSRDIRTVGELLHDVDYTARHLLMDVAGDDAGPLLRGWPDLVAAAASLWSSAARAGAPAPTSAINPSPACSAHDATSQELAQQQGLATGEARPIGA